MMTRALSEYQISILSPTRATLVVSRNISAFGITRESAYDINLGFREKPLYKIVLPDTPVDDRLRISVINSGQFLEDEFAPSSAYCAWVAGSAAMFGHELISVLPAGEYDLVRTRRALVRKDRIVLGNQLVPSPPGVRALIETRNFYSYAFGPDPNKEVSPHTPWLGIPVLNYVGTKNIHGVLFFSFARYSDVAVQTDGDLVLIVPKSGSLILNTKVGWPAETIENDAKSWGEKGAADFVAALAA